MPKVTIRGVINSDVCARGEQHTVEMTPRLRGLINNRVVEIVETHDDETPTVAAEPAPRKRRPRRSAE